MRNTTAPQHVLIVGAGPAGLTSAAELIKAGLRVTVLEQDSSLVGGISKTIKYKGYRFDLGGHRFFTKNADVVNWWRQRLPNDFVTVRRQSRILYRHRFYDYPLKPWNALRNLGLCMSGLCVGSYLWAQLFPVQPERSFEDWVSNRFGRRLFRIFFKTYTEKVWGMPCSEISADWAGQRIKGLSLLSAIAEAFRWNRGSGEQVRTLIDRFEYPRLGPGMMWEKTRDDLVRGGMELNMGRTVIEIRRDEDRVVSVKTRDQSGNYETWHADQFIVSMPLRDTILQMSPSLSSASEQSARQLKYRDFFTVALMVRKERLFTDNWIYIHDPGVRVGRVQNFNNWSPEMVPVSGVTCLGLEYFCSVGDELWCRSDEELVELAKCEAAAIGLASSEQIFDGCVVRVEKAYPVYNSAYQRHLEIIRTSLQGLRNFQVIGRNGMHRYNNQDHSMMTGMLAAKNVLGGRWDLWRVNTDAEYHEEEKRFSP